MGRECSQFSPCIKDLEISPLLLPEATLEDIFKIDCL